jgi:hypothetical protein
MVLGIVPVIDGPCRVRYSDVVFMLKLEEGRQETDEILSVVELQMLFISIRIDGTYANWSWW